MEIPYLSKAYKAPGLRKRRHIKYVPCQGLIFFRLQVIRYLTEQLYSVKCGTDTACSTYRVNFYTSRWILFFYNILRGAFRNISPPPFMLRWHKYSCGSKAAMYRKYMHCRISKDTQYNGFLNHGQIHSKCQSFWQLPTPTTDLN